ncbi:astacin [Cooperia oncophora]
MMKKLQLSNEKKAEIDRKLKEIEERRDDTVEDLKDTIFEINSEKNVGKVLFQSDILLTKRQQEEVMEASKERPVDPKDKRSRIKHILTPRGSKESSTASTMTSLQNEYSKWVRNNGKKQPASISPKIKTKKHCVNQEDGCWSYVGRVGGEQPLSLGDGCDQVGIATHELGHALGLFHTMSRYDRDEFITVVLDNVVEGFVDQYVKETNETTTNYGFTYDYGSIMHYGAASASHNKKPTMVANDTRYQESMGSQIISFIDKSMINDHYNCKGKGTMLSLTCEGGWTAFLFSKVPKCTSAKCQNGGFPHPRNCSECICPSGYGGALCDKRSPKADPSRSKKTWFGAGVRDEFMFCNYWIEADEGKKIEITVKSISHGYAHDGCILGGVEIKTTEDQTRTGYRFCSPTYRDAVLVSASNRVPIIMFNRAGPTAIHIGIQNQFMRV